ncbi:major facilitator superfamily domain-containing protein [Talaromyces proteolyticus]|uniref:Major facilitator superfamily domain-containing protein n=1 Tax=Talaromyces proteolyticus TaxID=1131652 RepID=A0AAD4PW38_9EURO|nr:major facilitator superfamily domain-containing protein [Talaromyces proteolyticus]KAH8691477.1 major facilitator superfamily domain-containing protein [Talaromyces proteolyticus]
MLEVIDRIATQHVDSDSADSPSQKPSLTDVKGNQENFGSYKVDEFENNPFLNPELAQRYALIYEKSQYEGRHLFDPALTWRPEEEKVLIRKLDLHVCLWACVMFFSLQVDRGNLNQAVSDNFLDDLHLTTNDFNLGNTVFYVSFLLAELPSQLISKKIGPDRWIPMQITLWSVVAMAQAGLRGRGSFLATRALLGVLEGGFIPDIVLWLSYFYTNRELPIRLSIFWAMLALTGIVTSFIAFGVLHMRGVHGWSGWRWLFLIEGALTFAVGLASFFMMPASAVETKTWFRPTGWFTDRETAIAVNRVLRNDPSKGDMHNRQAITPRLLWNSLCDFDLWPLYILGLLVYIPIVPVSAYLTLTLRNIGFSTVITNLLTIPVSVASIFTIVGLTWFSEQVNERSLVAMLQNVWLLPCLFVLRFWPGLIDNAWGTYAVIVVLLSYPYSHAILVGWISTNSNNVGTRSVSAAIYNISVQLASIIGSNIYRADDAPLYHRGNTVLLILNFVALLLFILTKLYYIFRNKQRDRKWRAMSEQEKVNYLAISKDTGSKRLDFRFVH